MVFQFFLIIDLVDTATLFTNDCVCLLISFVVPLPTEISSFFGICNIVMVGSGLTDLASTGCTPQILTAVITANVDNTNLFIVLSILYIIYD